MISVLDERHIARGYDPYNSADQPWVMQLTNIKRKVKEATTPTKEQELAFDLEFYQRQSRAARNLSDAEIDSRIRRGFKYLENHPQLAAEVLGRALNLHRKMFRNPT